MENLDSGRTNSWWWDSHISSTNSKWLQDNLTDMDAKVKAMVKLIEEDADSFARRAEMYYKKRPELMKLVEEFYQAYRALAGRYDHATGVIRHAHRTMAKVYSNRVPSKFSDDSRANSGASIEPRSPETSTPVHVICEEDEQNEALGSFLCNCHDIKQNGVFTDESDCATRKTALKQLNGRCGSVQRVRKGLNFEEALNDQELSKSNHEHESEELQILKMGLAKLEAEKEAGLLSYQQSSDKLCQLESQVAQTREDFLLLSDHATKAENEVVVLKEALTKAETEKESMFQEYKKCLVGMSEIQNVISSTEEDSPKLAERASIPEVQAQSVNHHFEKLTIEKDIALDKYMHSLEMIAELENKLRLSGEDARRFKERAEKAEKDVEILKQTVSRLMEEKEAAAMQYQKCLEAISSLELRLASSGEEAKRLHVMIDDGECKLKGAKEQCFVLEKSNESLHADLDLLMLKMDTQTEELKEKQKDLDRLWAWVQEERSRFVEAESTFQTLRHLHAQTWEELQSMASKLQNKDQLLMAAETRNQSLEGEILQAREENERLHVIYAFTGLSIADVKKEITMLKDSKGKIVEDLELQHEQRRAMEQDVDYLKQELNALNIKHGSVLDDVQAVGLNTGSLYSSVEELRKENLNLQEICFKESSDKAVILEKLEILEQILEKNSHLDTSLSNLNAALNASGKKIEALEQSCKSLLKENSTLLDEKATFTSQLQETNENLKKISENNNRLVNSISISQYQIEALKAKSKILEDSCHSLAVEKSILISQKDGLHQQLGSTQTKLESLGQVHAELERRFVNLLEEKESNCLRIEELQVSLDAEKKLQVSLNAERQQFNSDIQASERQLSGTESDRRLLHKECQQRNRELDQVVNKVLGNEFELLVICMAAQDLEESNRSLLVKHQKLSKDSSLLEKKVSELEQRTLEQTVEIRSLSDQVNSLRAVIFQLSKVLDISEDKTTQDQICANMLFHKLQNMKETLTAAREENHQWSVESSVLVTWIRQLRLGVKNNGFESHNIDHEFTIRTEQLSLLLGEVLKLYEMNDDLRSQSRAADQSKETLVIQVKDMAKTLMDMHSISHDLQREKSKLSEESTSLMNNFLRLKEEKAVIERELGANLDKLQDINAALTEKLSSTEEKLVESKIENHDLKERLLKSEDEVHVVATVRDQLHNDVGNGACTLLKMEFELQEAEQKISMIEKEKQDLKKNVEVLRIELSEFRKVQYFQEKEILKLSADKSCLSKHNNLLLKSRQRLEDELTEFHRQNNARKMREDGFLNAMQNIVNENKKLEILSFSLFGQLQYSVVIQVLYEQKSQELREACLGYIDQIEGFKTQIAAYRPEILALRRCITELENQTDIQIKLQNPENEMQDVEVYNHIHGYKLTENKKNMMREMFSQWHDPHARLQLSEKASVDAKDSSMRQVNKLNSDSSLYGRNRKPASEISDADGMLLMKDVVLDQISDDSPYTVSKGEHKDMDNEIVELWETSDPDGTIGLTVGKSGKVISPRTVNQSNFYRAKSTKKQKEEVSSLDRLIEKELSIDKLEISKQDTGTLQEGEKRKIVERLDSDLQKLANLQITVQDLKRKLEVTEKGKRGKAVIECEALKGQLEEADTAILKLFDLNGRLTKKTERNDFSDAKRDGQHRTRRILDQARRMSEKIGRLRLEVQKLQFGLLKLDEPKEDIKKPLETKRRVMLRDYLYGRGRTVTRQKKVQFCACAQPQTFDR